MREIVLDTETTGLDPRGGDRIVEIGAVELVNHLPTGKEYHVYINPNRSMPAEAEAVHGLSDAFLADKPRFHLIVDEFLDFIGTDSRLVIHNASFDMAFLNAELEAARRPIIPMVRALDTLAMARKRFPGSPCTLDALCRRFAVDSSARDKHGALLDSQLLAAVYLELCGGRQPDLVLAVTDQPRAGTSTMQTDWRPRPRPTPLPPRLTEAEATAHAAFVAALGDKAIWKRYDAG
ncbi:DNA polymerase III subunit epsilon [Paracoccus sp. p4-l81]|uniref:DNA polymerase III subunit epsilon n=1 Tax=unclassified Paracoccus (in: a-proteobacteria) TaxID=2688777 RepID=UPI0035B6E157